MTKKLIAYVSLIALVFAAGPVIAGSHRASAELNTPGTNHHLLLPEAADNSPVISLGSSIDPATGKKVEGVAFIHYKPGFGHKPNHNPGGNKGNGGTDKCFSHLAKGAKWRTVEQWVMNSANTRGLDQLALFALQSSALERWEDAASGAVGDGESVEIFGAGAETGAVLSADMSSPDGANEVYFADVSSKGAIAVTIVWGIFYGPPSQRELVEWDMVFDDADFDWSAEENGVAGKMDFDNIASHEDGHAAGMGHPDDACTEETMYRFADSAETKKRDLNAGDIAGIKELYK